MYRGKESFLKAIHDFITDDKEDDIGFLSTGAFTVLEKGSDLTW